VKGGSSPLVETHNMENTDGNASPPGGLESADSRSPADAGIVSRHPLAEAQEHLARAKDQLTYGRRQEAEGALLLIEEASKLIAFYRNASEEGIGSG